jgi:phosphate transport system protein
MSDFRPQIENSIDAQIRCLAEMGGQAEDIFQKSLEALETRNVALAEEVIKQDKELDKMEMQLEKLAFATLSMHQPLLHDLRQTIASVRLASTLERIGDLSKNISRRSLILFEERESRMTVPIVRMGRQALSQLNKILDAYLNKNMDEAIAVWKSDVDVDGLYNSAIRELLTYMMEDPRNIGICTQLMFIAKNIERIGDHTTFIAEMAYYVNEGKTFQDKRPKGSGSSGIMPPKTDKD